MLAAMVTSLTAIGYGVDTSGGSGTTQAEVLAEPAQFSIQLPTSLPIHINSDGTIVTSESAKIVNNSSGPIDIKEITITPLNGWQLKEWSTNFNEQKVDSKLFSLEILGDNSYTGQKLDITNSKFTGIEGGGAELGLAYDAKLPAQTQNMPSSSIANVTITAGWSTPPAPEIEYTNFTITAANRDKIGFTGAENENLIIPSTFVGEDGVNYKVTAIGASAFYDCKNLASVTIPNSVTKISGWAFHDCTNLTSVTITDSSVVRIGDGTFIGCTNLTSVTIPDSVTEIGNRAFEKCTSLASVTIPEGVEIIGYWAFYGCTNLTSVTIPEGVTAIDGGAFGSCTSLASVTLPNSMKVIDTGAFSDCSSLTSVTIPNSVTIIGENAFVNVPHIYYNGTAIGSPWGALAIN